MTEPPSWLDAAFVQEALRRGGEADTVVTSVTSRPVGAPGDNYGSLMYRVTAETNSGTLSLIVKAALPLLMESPPPFNAFMHETYMLSKALPEFHKVLNDFAPGKFPALSPKCLHSGTTPTEFIVMEDLATQGFQLASRLRGLGIRHSLLALRTLARFHAASTVLLDEYPIMKEILKNPIGKLECFYHPFVTSSFKEVLSVYKNNPGFQQESLEAVRALSEKAFDKYVKVNDYKPGRFNVICHGDFWSNNMLFRYEDDEVREVRFVDYQLSRVTSPAIDLHYFFSTSVSEDVSVNHADMLLREYHFTLAETMKLLGMVAPSFEDLMEDMQESGFHAVVNTIITLPIIKTASEKTFDVEKALDGDTQGNSFIYSSTETQRWLSRLLPEFYSKGWLSL